MSEPPQIHDAMESRDGGTTASLVQHAASQGRPVADPIERQRAVVGMLRQLASGLSAYRLFPGDLKQPSFVQVVHRIREAADQVLRWGPFEAEISGSRFNIGTVPLPADERIERLAVTFYQHRAERFFLRAVPDARELGVLYGALSKPPATSDAAAGVGSALRVGGVKAMSVREVAPQGQEGDGVRLRTTSEQRALWDKLGKPAEFARELVAAVSHLPTARAAAKAISDQLRDILAELPERLVRSSELYGRLNEVVVRLPKVLRRALMALLLDTVLDDPLAERLIGTMTDAELARVLVDQGAEGGADPVGLARRLVTSGVRREDIVDLATAIVMGRVEGGTIIAGLERVGIEPVPATASPMTRTVSNLLARGLVSAGQEDVRAIREAFPASPEAQRTQVFDALGDYLRIETDEDRLGEVLGVWADETVYRLRTRNVERVAQLLRVLEGTVQDEVGLEKRALVEATINRALSSDMLAILITVEDGEANAGSTVALLRPFGEAAVECLMEEVAREPDRGRRALLLGILGEVARGHHHRVAKRLSDPRWFVARNAVSVLTRVGGREVVPLLVEASHHGQPAVRREAVKGLLAAAGPDALPDVLRLAADPDESVRATVITALGALTGPGSGAALAKVVRTLRDPPERKRAMEALAHHPSPESMQSLEDLASPRSRPRLPRRLRAYAKTLAKGRRGGIG